MAASKLNFVLITFGILRWEFELDAGSIGRHGFSTDASRAPWSKDVQAISHYVSELLLLVRGLKPQLSVVYPGDLHETAEAFPHRRISDGIQRPSDG